MSYTRYAWNRIYTLGESNLYSFIGGDGDLWIAGNTSREGFEIIEKEDIFELVVTILEHADINFTKEQMK